jgi:hypothetical protein
MQSWQGYCPLWLLVFILPGRQIAFTKPRESIWYTLMDLLPWKSIWCSDTSGSCDLSRGWTFCYPVSPRIVSSHKIICRSILSLWWTSSVEHYTNLVFHHHEYIAADTVVRGICNKSTIKFLLLSLSIYIWLYLSIYLHLTISLYVSSFVNRFIYIRPYLSKQLCTYHVKSLSSLAFSDLHPYNFFWTSFVLICHYCTVQCVQHSTVQCIQATPLILYIEVSKCSWGYLVRSLIITQWLQKTYCWLALKSIVGLFSWHWNNISSCLLSLSSLYIIWNRY